MDLTPRPQYELSNYIVMNVGKMQRYLKFVEDYKKFLEEFRIAADDKAGGKPLYLEMVKKVPTDSLTDSIKHIAELPTETAVGLNLIYDIVEDKFINLQRDPIKSLVEQGSLTLSTMKGLKEDFGKLPEIFTPFVDAITKYAESEGKESFRFKQGPSEPTVEPIDAVEEKIDAALGAVIDGLQAVLEKYSAEVSTIGSTSKDLITGMIPAEQADILFGLLEQRRRSVMLAKFKKTQAEYSMHSSHQKRSLEWWDKRWKALKDSHNKIKNTEHKSISKEKQPYQAHPSASNKDIKEMYDEISNLKGMINNLKTTYKL